MTKVDTPTPPKHLTASTCRWWASVASEFILDPHHLRILTLAGEAWDRCEQARKAIRKHGITYLDRFDQPKARPEVAIERDSRTAFARMVRELALDVDLPTESRPPSVAGRGLPLPHGEK